MAELEAGRRELEEQLQAARSEVDGEGVGGWGESTKRIGAGVVVKERGGRRREEKMGQGGVEEVNSKEEGGQKKAAAVSCLEFAGAK